MNLSLSELLAALPEIVMLFAVCFILLVDVFISERYRVITYYLTQLTLIIAFVLALSQFKTYIDPITIFSGHYILDELAVLSKLFIYLFSFLSFIYARDYIQSRKIARSEYYLLGLLAVLGMSIMASAYSFLTIYLGLELLSLALYTMIAMHKESYVAIEAAMKYFVLGGLASGMLLYGMSLLYGITGSIRIDVLGEALSQQQTVVTMAALVFVLGGLIFKFGAVPFHMWVPDVYQGAPTSVTLFIASAPKIAAFVITMRILVQAMFSLHLNWEHILIIISIFSMCFGNVLAIVQSNFKRMLAYSSIAHVGYTLLGILAGPIVPQGYAAALFYIATYALVASGAFAIIAIMSKGGVELDQLNDYRGLNARNPWLAFMMLLMMFSMAGVPPAVGFFAKLGLLQALVQADMVWLAVLALIFALIGAYYYLRVIMLMYFEEPTEETNTPILVSSDVLVAISINGSAALFLGLFPSFFIDLCRVSIG